MAVVLVAAGVTVTGLFRCGFLDRGGRLGFGGLPGGAGGLDVEPVADHRAELPELTQSLEESQKAAH